MGLTEEEVKKSGYDEVSLTSLSTADYSCIAPLIKKVVDKLAPEKVSLGVSSLRAYGLEENVLDDMQRFRLKGGVVEGGHVPQDHDCAGDDLRQNRFSGDSNHLD